MSVISSSCQRGTADDWDTAGKQKNTCCTVGCAGIRGEMKGKRWRIEETGGRWGHRRWIWEKIQEKKCVKEEDGLLLFSDS